jgi:hypothetical protein
MTIQTPENSEKQRLQKTIEDDLILSQISANNLNPQQIENATPSDLKAMGIAKLPIILLSIGWLIVFIIFK